MEMKKFSKRRKYKSCAVLLFCALLTVLVSVVLLFDYKPNKNALGALGTVCMDVNCMVVLLILVVSLVIENESFNRTTKLFLALMLETMFAMFFDLLNWVYDGTLSFDNGTYLYTIASLVQGSVLAGIFCMYLSSYMTDLYKLKESIKSARVCAALNICSFVVTLILAFTHTAFTFVNGHYQIGALYDIVTAIPVLTLLYMTGYAIVHVKTIGWHDVIAVTGYILTMICGTMIEAIFTVGATYVSIALADVFIFVMLQNKLIDNVRQQREILAKKISSQYEILESMAGIYTYVNYVDLEKMVTSRFDTDDGIFEPIDEKGEPHSNLNKILYYGLEEELQDKFWAYTDLSTLSERMKNEKMISAEFCHKDDGWFRARYIRIGDSVEEPLKKVIYTVLNIDEEKKNVEKWIRKSNTDELTGFYNRNAYESDIVLLEQNGLKDNFVYVSIDVNSLKIVNDTLGHEAGDELIVGACKCMKQCFGAYGKLYRTGGDEFAALIYADASQLEEIKKDLEEVTENWHGELNEHLAISCGYATGKDNMPLHMLAALADRRMYDNKTNYYRMKGIDRRGQRDAHVALCALYTKILKVNVTDDTYQIVNMDMTEKSPEMGYSDKISEWISNFGISGQVHPEDLDTYLSHTNLYYLREYFKNNKMPLRIFYRRKLNDDFRRTLMEIIPANDYTDDNQSLFLYVKDLEE